MACSFATRWPPGSRLPRAELMPPLLVKKGARVVMLLDSPGIALTAEGRALEAGGANDRIRVQNPISHAVVEAEVLADGRVRVTPGVLPLQLPGGQSSGGQAFGGQTFGGQAGGGRAATLAAQ